MSDRRTLSIALIALRRNLSRFASSPLPEWDTFARQVSLARVPKNGLAGTEPDEVLIVLRGCLKVVYQSSDPKIDGQIGDFFTAGTIVAPRLRPPWAGRFRSPLAIPRWYGAKASPIPKMTAYACEDTLIMRFNAGVVQQLAVKYPQWGEIYSATLWTQAETLHNGLIGFRSKSISARYLDLMERKDLRGRITQREIAAYLGVTESALSRLIRRIEEESPADAAQHEPDTPGLTQEELDGLFDGKIAAAS